MNLAHKYVQLKKGDILVVKINMRSAEHGEEIMRLKESLSSRYKEHGVSVLIVDENIDISSLDEEEMRELGWVRAGAGV